MPIDFKDEQNKFAYVGREAHEDWMQVMQSLVPPEGLEVVDIGCGGGIYSKAWAAIGASSVKGIDSSEVMISAARQHCEGIHNIAFSVGDALATGLPDGSADLVFERALIHHLPELQPYIEEAFRVLRPGGKLTVQDRTPEDVALPGSASHIRGYIFEAFPKLLSVEMERRRTVEDVVHAMRDCGFEKAQAITVWETRKVHASWSELQADLRGRTGRSILHELDDTELESVISFIQSKLLGSESEVITEMDRWTIWHATKPPIQ